jgi:hypothetical protein
MTYEDWLNEQYKRRMSLPPEQRAEIERLHAERLPAADAQFRGTSPADIDPVESAAVEIADDPVVGESGPSAGLFANLPAYTEAQLDAASGRDEERIQEKKSRMLESGAIARNFLNPEEVAERSARTSVMTPRDPMSAEPTPYSVREMNRQLARDDSAMRDEMRAQEEAARDEAMFGEGDRQRANIQRLIRTGVNPMQDMTAPTPEQQGQFDDWAKTGSVDRMRRYAPAEFAQRQAAAQAQWSREGREELARLQDPEYRDEVRDRDDRNLRATDVRANRALAEELAGMGLDPRQFGDWKSEFDRKRALDAKMMFDGQRKGNVREAVIRNAQMRQNPVEFLGRPDIDDDQRLATLFYLANGRGPTPNEVRQLQAKGVLEGIQVGARSNLNVGDAAARDAVLNEKIRQDRFNTAMAAADDFFAQRATGMFSKSLSPEDFQDLLVMLGGFGLDPQQVNSLGMRYRRTAPRAERTAPGGA